MVGIKDAEARLRQMEKASRNIAECLVQWLDAEPEDKTRH
jgi:hypothetical protein